MKVPKNGYCMICVLMTDIYDNEEWNFVFGLAMFRIGIFSFARYEESFYNGLSDFL